jgi:uncharacterized protein YbaP (TraB family)
MNFIPNRNWSFLLLFCCFYSFADVAALNKATASSNVATPNIAATSKRSVSPLFWQLDYQGTTAFAFGSIHLGEPDMYPLPDYVMDGFKASDTLVVEVNLDEINESDMTALTLRHGIDKKRPLSRWLSRETQKQYRQYCQKSGLPCDKFARFKPWLVGITIMSVNFQQSGYDAKLGIDKYFITQAKGKKPIISLETAEQQLGLLANLPGDIQQELLVQSMQTENSSIKEMIDSWYQGNESHLIELFGKIHDKGLEKVFHEQILIKRNVDMVDKLMVLLKAKNSVFFVVGTAHLVGPDNMLELLRKQGVVVTKRSAPNG